MNGTVDESEAAAIEAHLAECAECREDLAAERMIGHAMASIPLDMERGWARMRDRLEQVPAPIATGAPEAEVVALRKGVFRRSIPLRWAVTVQAAAAVLIIGASRLAMPVVQAEPLYHTLGSAPQTAPGNVAVIFRPNTTERELRKALVSNNAEMVGGPTASDAYVLRVTSTERDTALARLRENSHVVLAQPIDVTARE
jgi:hypothetical protein